VAIQALSKNGISIISDAASYNRFDGTLIEHKLETGWGVTPNYLMNTLDNGLNNRFFYNKTYYAIKK